MGLGKKYRLVLLAGLIVANPAWAADGPQTLQEKALIAQLRATYEQQGMSLTPEIEELMLQRMRQTQRAVINAQVVSGSVQGATPMQQFAATMGSLQQDGVLPAAPIAAPVATPVSAAPAAGMTAGQLQSAIAERHAQGARTVFEQRADGFLADGRPVLDPSGRIEMFGGDGASGDVTYFVRTGPDQLAVRFANVHSQLGPVTVGSIAVDADAMRFASADGQTVAGDNVIPTGRGVVVSRDSAVFAYDYGQVLATRALPEGFQLAPYQRGDVAGTGYVLLRRDIAETEKQNAVKNVVGLFKGLVGKEDSKDYALLNVASGKLVYLNVDESGENVHKGYGCRKKNAFVNKCEGMETYASPFKPDGMRNLGHYYWRIDWTATAQGPTALALERGLRDLTVIRLDNEQRVTAFTRALGIERFGVEPLNNGSVKLTADWAFRSHEIADVNALFAPAGEPTSVAAGGE